MAGEAGGQSFAAQSGDVVLFDMARPATFGISAPDHRRGGWRTAFLMIPRARISRRCATYVTCMGWSCAKGPPSGKSSGPISVRWRRRLRLWMGRKLRRWGAEPPP